MSGITALVHLDAAPLNTPHLQTMTDVVLPAADRNAAVWSRGGVGLGQVNLPTMPEPADEFPLTFDDRVFLVADARIDDQQTLRSKLRAAGRDVRAECSDAELILHAYHVWGRDALLHLIGDFTFILYDSSQGILLGARDQLGVRPFFYAIKNGLLICSSVLAAIRAHPAVSDQLNEHVLADFLTIGFPAEFDSSIFADVQRLAPGHVLLVEDGRVSVQRYWSPPTIEWRTWEEDEAAEAVFHTLEQAVQDRLRTPDAVVSMSGGLDSTAIAAIAHRLWKENRSSTRIRAISAGALWLLPDTELYYARLTADHCGFPIEYCQVEDFIPRLTSDNIHESWQNAPEPVDVFSATVAGQIMKAAAASESIQFSGLGGDPLFNTGAYYLTELMQQREWYQVPFDLLRQQRSGRKVLQRMWAARQLQRSQSAAVNKAVGLLNPDFARRINAAERFRHTQNMLMSITELEGFTRKPLWAYFLAASDPGFHNVHTRTLFPFFDLRLYQLVLQMPPMPLRWGKRILRKALTGMLPETVLNRPKTPLPSNLLREAFQLKQPAWITELAADPVLQPFVDLATINEQAQDPDKAPEIMKVLAVAYWLKYSWRGQ